MKGRTAIIGRLGLMTGGSRCCAPWSIRTLFGVGSVGGMEESELLEQFLSRRDEGAEAAFAALVALHGPMVWDVCRGVLSDSHAAEDAFQATFLILVRKAGSIRRREAIGPWLYGVARRVAVRARSTAALRRLRERQGEEVTVTPAADPLRREQLGALHEEVDRLPARYRAAVVLCHLEGRTHAEAARLLDCPVGTISTRLSRARERLRARLTGRGLALPAVTAAAMLYPRSATAAMPAGLAESTIKAALRVAAGQAITAGAFPASAVRLAGGELRTMSMTKLAISATYVLAAGLATAGVGLLAAGEQPARGKRDAAPVTAAPARPARDDREARARCLDNFKTFGIAFQNYAAAHGGRLPTAAIRKDDQPLLSWRVALLPYLGQKALHDRFHLDEPWDSPHNKALLEEMPAVYAPVVPKDRPPYSTYDQVFVGPGTLFEGDEGTARKDIKDGRSFTLMVVEGAEPVPWTKPEDLPYDRDKPLPKLGGQFEDGAYATFADGAAFFLSRRIAPGILRALITRNGGEPVGVDDLHPFEEGRLQPLMEEVNARSNEIKRAIRNPVAYKKSQSQDAVATATAALIRLSKEAHGLSREGMSRTRGTNASERQWFELMDALTVQLAEFAGTASKAGSTQTEAKSAWNKVSRRCTDCHAVFRVEEQN